MYRVKETIIVEGLYDKIKLSRFIDGVIFVTNGFTVFTNKNMQASIKALGEKTGIVILTDSDSAGFRIRNFVKQLLPDEYVGHAYIPNIEGKEKRKRTAGKEGFLGVEGVSDELIIKALKDAGCDIDGTVQVRQRQRDITKADMYAAGLSGGEGSRQRRERLTEALGLPYKISSNMLLDVLNRLLSPDELREIVQKLDEMPEENCL